MTELADGRGIWAALEFGGPRTLEDLEMIADVLPADSVDYLQALIRNGYVSMIGVKRAAGGEARPLFKLIKRTGPEAPYEDEDGTFIDPNVAVEEEQPRGLLIAHMRLAAERLKGPFTIRELRAATPRELGSQTRKFDGAWARLKRNLEIVRGINPLNGELGGWFYRLNSDVARLRSHFKQHVGEEVLSTGLKKAVGTANGMLIRQALDLLIAEGYQVNVTRPGRKAVAYRIEAPLPGSAGVPAGKRSMTGTEAGPTQTGSVAGGISDAAA